MFDVLGLYAFYALSITFGKAAMNYAQPLFFLGIRLLISAPILLGYVYFFKRDQFRLEKSHLFLFAQSSGMLYCGYAFGFWALQHMASGKNALIFTLTPFVTAFLMYILYGEKLSKRQIGGLVIGFGGAIFALLVTSSSVLTAQYNRFGLAEIFAIMAIICGAYGWILADKLTKQYQYSPFFINGVNMLFSGILLLLTSPFLNTRNLPYYTQLGPFIMYVLVLSFICDIVAYNWYMILLKKYTTTFVAFAGFVVPLFVAFYSWIWLGETVSWQFYVSLTLIFIGLFVFYQEELRNRSITKKN